MHSLYEEVAELGKDDKGRKKGVVRKWNLLDKGGSISHKKKNSLKWGPNDLVTTHMSL